MNPAADLDVTVVDQADLRDQVGWFLAHVPWHLPLAEKPAVQLVWLDASVPVPAHQQWLSGPQLQIAFEEPDLRIGLYAPDWIRQPRAVLQGALGMALALVPVRRCLDTDPFNFRRTILPLLPTSGSAIQVIRHLAAHLETGVQRWMAMERLVAAGQGMIQVMYCFHGLLPDPENGEVHPHLAAHAWMKAMCLARLFKTYAPVQLVARRSGSLPLIQFWGDCHPYLQPPDHQCLERLCVFLAEASAQSCADRIAGLFIRLRDSYLAAAHTPPLF